MSTGLVILSYDLIICHPLLLSSVWQHQSLSTSRFFSACGHSIGASVSALVLPMNIQGWFPLGITGLISLLSKELSRVFSCTTLWKHQFFSTQPSLWPSSHPYMATGKTKALTWTLSAKWCLCFLVLYVFQGFSFKEQTSFNFMVAVTIYSDSGAQED